MNADQLQGIIRTLLAAGGPIAGLLIQYGVEPTKANNILALLLIILPPIASGVWSYMTKTDAAKVASAGAMPGVSVTVSSDAPAGAQAAAADPKVTGVNPGPVEPTKDK